MMANRAGSLPFPYLPTKLPTHAALQIAHLARVPRDKESDFCEFISGNVQMVWHQDRRGVSSKSSQVMAQAAKAARALEDAVRRLNKCDHDWIQRILAQEPGPTQERLREFPLTVELLASLLDKSIGSRLPVHSLATPRRKKNGRTLGSVNDATFHDFVWYLLLSVELTGGELTLDKNAKKGTLADSLNLLRQHLPKGVVPNALPFGTLQKIKTKFHRVPH
jgi:hypothetical protein